jgi:hypothetical protein
MKKYTSMSESADLQPCANEKLAAQYRKLAGLTTGPLNEVLYPCCESDTTQSLAFPGADVTYVDMNRDAIRNLLKDGYRAQYGRVPTGREQGRSDADSSDAPVFRPVRPVDLLVLLNPQIAAFDIVQWVRNGGYVLCNNNHDTAD